ncbi:MAG: hypothetical protein ACOH2F_16100 [Cellulomonas sp.]
MTYDHHIARAARYAALALTDREPNADELDQIHTLHDDVAINLAQTIQRVTLIAPTRPLAVQIIDVARHPVRTLLNRLTALPRMGPEPDQLPAPSQRWADRPAGPAAAHDPIAVWKGLAIEVFLAGEALDALGPELTDAARWSAAGDIATLAHLLAVSNGDLLDQLYLSSRYNHRNQPPDHHQRRARGANAALAIEAREVIRLAGIPIPTDARVSDLGPIRVVTLPRLAALPAATKNLTHLIETQPASVTDLLAVARVLSQVSAATATALTTAATAPSAGLPALLTATSAALHDHAVAVARVVVAYQTRLGTLEPGSSLTLGQAREIGAIAIPRLRDLALRPTQAEATSPALLEYAASVADTTRVLRDEFAALHQQHSVLIRDRTDSAAYGWRPSHPSDLAALRTGLDRAATAAQRAPAPPQTRPTPSPEPAGVAQVLDLQAALARRQVQLRPARPTSLVMKGRFLIKNQQIRER